MRASPFSGPRCWRMHRRRRDDRQGGQEMKAKAAGVAVCVALVATIPIAGRSEVRVGPRRQRRQGRGGRAARRCRQGRRRSRLPGVTARPSGRRGLAKPRSAATARWRRPKTPTHGPARAARSWPARKALPPSPPRRRGRQPLREATRAGASPPVSERPSRSDDARAPGCRRGDDHRRRLEHK